MITCDELNNTLDQLIASNKLRHPDIAESYRELKGRHDHAPVIGVSHEALLDEVQLIHKRRVIRENRGRNGRAAA